MTDPDSPGDPPAESSGHDATAESDAGLANGDDHDVSGDRRRKVVVAVAVAVLLVGVIGAVVLWPSGSSGYDDEVEANFMAACTDDGGDDVEPVCGCLYTEIVDTIPYDRFEEVNDALETERAADADAEIRLPADFDEIRASCVDREGAVASTEGDGEPDSSTTTVGSGDTTTTAAPSDSPVITSDTPNAAVPGGVRPTLPARPPPPPPGPSGAPAPPAPPGGDDPPPETTIPPDTAPVE